MKITFLGTGGSLGVPLLGCQCSVCSSSSSKDKRMRPSVLIEVHGKNLLIDAGPDFRTAALKWGVKKIDGVLITHTHYDHSGGFDDLRVFAFKKPLPCLLSASSKEEILFRYHYLFKKTSPFAFETLPEDFGKVEFLGVPITYVTYLQSGMKVNGFRIEDFAYISDIREYNEEVLNALKGVKTLVLSALRETASTVHFSLQEAIDFAGRVGAQTWLTHISHDLEREKVEKILPSTVQLAYDGLTL